MGKHKKSKQHPAKETAWQHPGASRGNGAQYLTVEQMTAMDPYTNLIVDVTHLTGQECKVYTCIANILSGIDLHNSETKLPDGRRLVLRVNKMFRESIKLENPEQLFHKMNSGTDEDLLRWQQFCISCLISVVIEYVVHGAPIRALVDDEVLPPGKGATRQRARIIAISEEMRNFNLLRKPVVVSPSKTSKASPGRAPALKELGDDDIVRIDVTELIGRKKVLETTRAAVQEMYDDWYPLTRNYARHVYKEDLETLKSASDLDLKKAREACIEVAVLARLLYKIPLRVLPTKKPEACWMECRKFMDASQVDSFIKEPTPEMMHPIAIPTSVADKGGYIVAGEFRPGAGIETVHLQFNDFEPDEHVTLHLSNMYEKCLVTASIMNRAIACNVEHLKKIASQDRQEHGDVVNHTHEISKLPNISTFQYQLLTNEPAATEKLKVVIEKRKQLTLLRQALYGTPARLFYTSDHSTVEHDARRIAYLDRVRDVCIKKLAQTSEFGQCSSLMEKTAPEMMHPITIPADVADKGGYIVAGEFRPGFGVETVHLKFSDFGEHDDIILHLSNVDQVYLPTAIIQNRAFINDVVRIKRAMRNDIGSSVGKLVDLQSRCKFPENSSFEDELLRGDPSATEQLAEVMEQRKLYTIARQAMHGTPARLYYTSDTSQSFPEANARVTAYLARVRELCRKKLFSSDTVQSS